MLLLVALLLIPLFGIAALVIDVGFARLTYLQMRTASETASLEGLRFRDDPTVAEADRDRGRRERASESVGLVYDDDLDPSNGDVLNYGAGPLLTLSDGVEVTPGFFASRLLSVPNPFVYEPTSADRGATGLELNLTNDPAGDLFASARSVGAAPDLFTASLRRLGVDAAVAGVRSSGPRLSAIFSVVLPLFEETDSGPDAAIRGRGIGLEVPDVTAPSPPDNDTVAGTRAVMAVGAAQNGAAVPLAGAGDFVLEAVEAIGSDPDEPTPLRLPSPATADPVVASVIGGVVSAAGVRIGHAVTDGTSEVTTLGDSRPTTASPVTAAAGTVAYVPVVPPVGSPTADLVIGFVPVTFVDVPAGAVPDPSAEQVFAFVVGTDTVAAENATAVPTSPTTSAVFELHFAFAYETDLAGDDVPTEQTLLAPALVR
ncbi:MAG: hypothetical protein AAF532_04970 [Planctomycetota bacterium]